MVDRERVLVHLDTAERRAGQIGSWTASEAGTFLEDELTSNAVERALQVAIEALWDAGYLFMSGLRLGIPKDETSMPARLVEGGVLTDAEAELLDDLRGFRNVLVHRYGVLDREKVHAHALDAPEDIARLADAMRRALSELD